MRALEVEHVSKKFGKFNAVNDISFHVEEGEIVGFIGPNGAGKTTTLKMIGNLIYPTGGSIRICGYNIKTDREKALENISGIIENPGLYPYLTGMEHLKYIADIRKVTKEKLEECIEITGLEDGLKRKVGHYSLGMKQRLAIGMSMLTNPKLLILDEPTNGLDPTGTIELRNIILNLSKEKNIAVLFSSHILSEVSKIAERIVYINKGSIILPDKIEKEKREKYILRLSDVSEAIKLLNELTFVFDVRCIGNEEIEIAIAPNQIGKVMEHLTNKKIDTYEIENKTYDLENQYKSLFLQ